MPFKILEDYGGCVYLDGQKIMDIPSWASLDISNDISNADVSMDTMEFITYWPSFEITIHFNEPINFNLLNKMLDIGDSRRYNIEYTKRIQKRKHHKRRINKKWAKRYGYKEEKVSLNNLKLLKLDSNEAIFLQSC